MCWRAFWKLYPCFYRSFGSDPHHSRLLSCCRETWARWIRGPAHEGWRMFLIPTLKAGIVQDWYFEADSHWGEKNASNGFPELRAWVQVCCTRAIFGKELANEMAKLSFSFATKFIANYQNVSVGGRSHTPVQWDISKIYSMGLGKAGLFRNLLQSSLQWKA